MIPHSLLRPQKSTRPRRITAWLKERINVVDFCGGKVMDGRIGPHGRPSNKQQIAHINGRKSLRRHFLRAIRNADITSGVNGPTPIYASGNGRRGRRYTLACLDADCHGRGTPDEARQFVEYLSILGFGGQNIFGEPSTNGNGWHGYFVVDKLDADARQTNDYLRRIEAWAVEVLKSTVNPSTGERWKLTGIEVRGRCAVPEWDVDGTCTGYIAGSLMKLPTTFLNSDARTEDLLRTAVIYGHQAGRLQVPATCPTTTNATEWTAHGSSRSCDGTPIRTSDADERRYRDLAHRLLPSPLRATGSNRHLATAEDLAGLLPILEYVTANPNADDAMPVRRIEALWRGRYAGGHTDRQWDAVRFKLLRDWMSQRGWVDWIDEDYVIGEGGEKGRCCRWRVAPEFLALIRGGHVVREADGEVVHEGSDGDREEVGGATGGVTGGVKKISTCTDSSDTLSILVNPNRIEVKSPWAHLIDDFRPFGRPRFIGTTAQRYAAGGKRYAA